MFDPTLTTILLIEDDAFISRMYSEKLSLEGFNVIAATDGLVGWEKAQSDQPDIILLDIMLPKMDGWEVLDHLKAEAVTKDIPVILLTNLGSRKDIERGLELGAIDYLIKAHFIPSEVVEKIKSFVKKSD